MFKKAPTPNDWHTYVEERLSAFIDGQLSDEERAEVRRHLQDCERCQASLDSLGWTIKLLKQVPAPPLPRQFTLPVPEPKRAPATAGWLKWGLAAGSVLAASAFLILLSIDLLAPGRQNSTGAGSVAALARPTAAAVQPAQAPAQDRSSKPGNSASQPTTAPPVAPQVERQPKQAATAEPQPTSAAILAAPQPAQPPAPAAAPTSAPAAGAAAAQSPATSGTVECQGCGGAPTESFPQTPSTANGLGGGTGDASAQTPGAQPFMRSSTVEPYAETPPAATGLGAGSPEGTPAPSFETPLTAQSAAVPPSIITGTVSATTPLWVLEEPRNGSRKIGALPSTAIVHVLGRDAHGFWLQILYPLENETDRRGWVAAKFIDLSMPLDQVPLVEPTPGAPTPGALSLTLPRGRNHATATAQAVHAPSKKASSIATSATETSPPIIGPAASATHASTHATAAPTRSFSSSLSEMHTPTARILSPTVKPTSQPVPTVQDNSISTLRLAEIASLLASLLFAGLVLLLARI